MLKKRNSLHKNWWRVKCFNSDKTVLKWEEFVSNIVVDEGLYYALDVMFMSGSAYSSWYVALFNSDDTPADDWVYAQIGTDMDEFTDYDEATRPAWTPSAIVSNSLVAQVEFTASTGVDTTIYGAYIVNVNTKGDYASGIGILWCASRFATARPLMATEVLEVTYGVNSVDV